VSPQESEDGCRENHIVFEAQRSFHKKVDKKKFCDEEEREKRGGAGGIKQQKSSRACIATTRNEKCLKKGPSCKW